MGDCCISASGWHAHGCYGELQPIWVHKREDIVFHWSFNPTLLTIITLPSKTLLCRFVFDYSSVTTKCTGKKLDLNEDLDGYHLLTSLHVLIPSIALVYSIFTYCSTFHCNGYWGSALVTHSFCQCCQQALGEFFHAFKNDDPWWVSVIHPVNGDDKTSLIYLLGFEHSVGMQFLCSTGLVKEWHSRNANSVVIVRAEWEKFFIEQNLFYLVDGINQTAVSGCHYFFINCGSKSKLQHRTNTMDE